MKYLTQLALIFGICLVGDLVSSLLPFSFPGSVISMIFVLILLSSKVLKEEHLGESADFLLRNMTFFFIPPGVGILRYAALVQSIWWQLILVNLISLVACFAASSYTVLLVMRIQRLIARRHHA